MLKHLSLTAKLSLGFGLLIALLITLGTVGIFEIRSLVELNRAMYRHPFTVSNAVLRIDADIIRIHRAMKDVALARNDAEMEQAIAVVNRLEERVFKTFGIVNERFLGEATMIHSTRTLFQRWKPIRDEVISLMRQGRRDEAAAITKGRGAVHVENILESMNELTEFAQNKAREFQTKAGYTGDRQVMLMALLTLTALGGGVAFTLAIARSIARPAGQIAEVAEAIAKGDFSRSITYHANDEMGRMAQSLRHMLTGVVGRGHSIINSIPVHFWTADDSLRLTFINDLAANAVGLPPDWQDDPDRLPLTVADTLRDDHGATLGLARRCMTTARRLVKEVRYSNGPYTTHLQLVVSPLRDGKGSVAGVMGIALDITGHKQVEEELKKTRDAANQAHLLRDDFLSGMGHSIHTSLAGIHGILRLLEESPLSEEQRNWVDTAQTSERQLRHFINDLIDLSGLEQGTLELVEQPFSPAQMLDQLVAEFEGQTRAKGVQLSRESSPSLPARIRGDESRLHQVLGHLLDNAVKFTPSGSIALEAFLYEEQLDTVVLGFAITDTGIGIDDENIERLRRDLNGPPHAYGEPGHETGLGLTIARGLVTLMRGDLSVDSTPGNGTTVRFTARFRKVEADTATPTEPNGILPKTLRLLLAEDDPANRLSLSRLLERAGHEVHTVENGQQAVDAALATDYDCVLMDLSMPLMDGFQAAKTIRGQQTVKVPIIALSAHSISSGPDDLRDQGLDGYLQKPTEIDRLLETVRDAVAEARNPTPRPS